MYRVLFFGYTGLWFELENSRKSRYHPRLFCGYIGFFSGCRGLFFEFSKDFRVASPRARSEVYHLKTRYHLRLFRRCIGFFSGYTGIFFEFIKKNRVPSRRARSVMPWITVCHLHLFCGYTASLLRIYKGLYCGSADILHLQKSLIMSRFAKVFYVCAEEP